MSLSIFIILTRRGVISLVLRFLGTFDTGRKVGVSQFPAWLKMCFGVVVLGLIGFGIWSCNDGGGGSPSGPVVVRSKYSFENGLMGWTAQTYQDSQACVQVLQSEEHAKEGQYSLQMVMDLIGGDANKSKGEAWVDMRNNPPLGDDSIPIDLTNRMITAWVYAPQGARGDSDRSNGFQIFVKDEYWKNEYGPWLQFLTELCNSL